jgi:hypothetical protein
VRTAPLLAALLLAGCAAPAPPTAPSPAAAAAPTHLLLHGCANVGGLFGVPASAAQAYLPDGFQPLPAPDDPRGGVRLFVEGMRCGTATLDGQALGEARAFYEELEVQPPATWQREGVGSYTVPLIFLAQPTEVARAFAAWGFARAGVGNLSFQPDADTPAAQHGTFTASEGSLRVTITTTAAPPLSQAQPGLQVRQFGVQDKQVRSVVDANASASTGTLGAAQVDFAGDPPLLDQAGPAAPGGSSAGYDLDLFLTR